MDEAARAEVVRLKRELLRLQLAHYAAVYGEVQVEEARVVDSRLTVVVADVGVR